MYQPSGQAPFGHLLFMRRIVRRGMGVRSCAGRSTNNINHPEKKIPSSRLSLFTNAVRRDSFTVKGRYLTEGYVCLSLPFFFYCVLKTSERLSQYSLLQTALLQLRCFIYIYSIETVKFFFEWITCAIYRSTK